MKESELRQLFKNRFNCYADSEDVILAMDEDQFVKTFNEALSLSKAPEKEEEKFTKEEMINFAYWLRQGLNNIEHASKETDEHLDYWIKNYKDFNFKN